jgi:hypothetical protein
VDTVYQIFLRNVTFLCKLIIRRNGEKTILTICLIKYHDIKTFLISTTDGGEKSALRPGPLIPEKIVPGISVDPTTGVEKSVLVRNQAPFPVTQS